MSKTRGSFKLDSHLLKCTTGCIITACAGVRSVKEGDILVAHVQRGKYVFGKLLPKLAL